MKYSFLVISFLIQSYAFATHYTLYDLFSKDSINFSKEYFYEELVIPSIQSEGNIKFSYFGFKSQDLERFKRKVIIPNIKERWITDLSLNLKKEKSAIESTLKKKYGNDVELDKFNISDIELSPISYVGKVVTFQQVVTYDFSSNYESNYNYIYNYYYFNATTKEFYFEEDLWQDVNFESLINELTLKWAKLKTLLLQNNAQYNTKNDIVQVDRLSNNSFDSLSILLNNAESLLQNFSTSKTHMYWSGQGLIVRFDEPLYDNSLCHERWLLSLLLTHQELNGIFKRKSAIYRYLRKPRKLTTSVEGFTDNYYPSHKSIGYNFYDMFYLNFALIEDSTVKSISCIHPKYSADTLKMLYKNGKLIKRYSDNNLIDSIEWFNDIMTAQWTSESFANCNNNHFLGGKLNKVNFNSKGNIINGFHIDEDFYYTEYSYSGDLVFSTSYNVLSKFHSDNLKIYRSNSKLICDLEWGKCIRFDTKGRMIQKFHKQLIYDNDNKLIRLINDNRHYTIYFYDSENRIKKVLSNAEKSYGQKTYTFFYNRYSRIPYFIQVEQYNNKYNIQFEID